MTSHDNAYEALQEPDTHGQWAFGTSFDEPLAGVDTTVPDDVDRAALGRYCLMLGDDALISAQRLNEWTAHAPELEEEMALANIALDLIGQARLLLARAADAEPALVPFISEGTPVPDEDALAYFRDEAGFANVHLTELDNGDFAQTMVRLLVFATWRLAAMERLRASRDPVLAAVADKGVRELTYHRDYAARWVVTFGRGTDESRRRLESALIRVWPYVGELFVATETERALAETGVAVDPSGLRGDFDRVITEVLAAAGTTVPDVPQIGRVHGRAGRAGVHTERLGYLLAEMQCVARRHPEGRW